MNHGETENTEEKQKEVSHFRKKIFMQRRGDAKKREIINFSNRSNERIEFQTVAGGARNSLS